MPAISKLLIANRGEIAARVIRTARAMDIATVAVFSDPDANAPYVHAADEAVALPGDAPADTYLNAPAIIAAAQRSRADAIHPGYGFLSENAAFAQACAEAGLIFVGPPPQAIEAMGSKIAAKELMAAAGVPVLPGITDRRADDPRRRRRRSADRLPAAGQGGVRRRRPGHAGGRAAQPGLEAAVASARREAAAAFGDGTVFLERYLDAPRHIEVQIFGDTHGTLVHLFERECSIQRRYQKIIEEAPSPAVDEALRQELGEAAIAAGKAIGYTGAGTVEFVLDRARRFYFLEVNTRLQVEHPVTELVTGLDLVALQLQVAEGQPLPAEVRLATLTGHAIEARLYAEDVAAGFLPATGTLRAFDIPAARAPGGRRGGRRLAGRAALRRDAGQGDRARPDPRRGPAPAGPRLAEAGLHGVTSNRDLLVGILREPEFQTGHIDTGYLTRHDPARLARPGRTQPRPDCTRWPRRWPARPPAGLTAPVLRSIPSGWRNVPSAGPARHVRPRRAAARRSATGSPARPHRGGQRRAGHRPGRCARPPPAGSIADIDGIRREITVRQSGGTWDVDSYLGSTELTELPRFPDPAPTAAPGSLLAPMPGTVVRLEVAPGAHVKAGSPIVVLEAMKMEHSVCAPHDGVVTDIEVTGGQQVDVGTVLAVVDILAAEQ